MKNVLIVSAGVVVLGIAAFLVGGPGCAHKSGDDSMNMAASYTCTMHPEVMQTAPGNCPKCGMKLVAKK